MVAREDYNQDGAGSIIAQLMYLTVDTGKREVRGGGTESQDGVDFFGRSNSQG
jgi:hypothetical protein